MFAPDRVKLHPTRAMPLLQTSTAIDRGHQGRSSNPQLMHVLGPREHLPWIQLVSQTLKSSLYSLWLLHKFVELLLKPGQMLVWSTSTPLLKLFDSCIFHLGDILIMPPMYGIPTFRKTLTLISLRKNWLVWYDDLFSSCNIPFLKTDTYLKLTFLTSWFIQSNEILGNVLIKQHLFQDNLQKYKSARKMIIKVQV